MRLGVAVDVRVGVGVRVGVEVRVGVAVGPRVPQVSNRTYALCKGRPLPSRTCPRIIIGRHRAGSGLNIGALHRRAVKVAHDAGDLL